MKIRMTQTVQGSLDGRTVQSLVAGAEYSTVDSPRGDRLAKYHIKQGVAVAVAVDAVAVGDEAAPAKAPAKPRARK